MRALFASYRVTPNSKPAMSLSWTRQRPASGMAGTGKAQSTARPLIKPRSLKPDGTIHSPQQYQRRQVAARGVGTIVANPVIIVSEARFY